MLHTCLQLKLNGIVTRRVPLVEQKLLTPPGIPTFITGVQWGSCSSIFIFLISSLQIIVTRFTRRVPLVNQELITLPEHLSSPPFLVEIVLLDLQFYEYLLQLVVCAFVLFILAIRLSATDSDYPLVSSKSSCPFVPFLVAIELSVLLRVTASDYPLISSIQIQWNLCNPTHELSDIH